MEREVGDPNPLDHERPVLFSMCSLRRLDAGLGSDYAPLRSVGCPVTAGRVAASDATVGSRW